ncbi:MAG: hypothetical protein AAFN93_18950 [Bacteroidota bacterium]
MKWVFFISIVNTLATVTMRYVMVFMLYGLGTITNPYAEYDVLRGISFVIGHVLVLVYLGKKWYPIKRATAWGFLINAPIPLLVHLLRFYEVISWKFIPVPY